MGGLQPAQAPPSRLHSKVLPGSFELNVNDGVASLSSTGGALSIEVSGEVVSIVQLCEAGVASVLPAGVGGAHLEGVDAVGEAAERVRAGAGSPGAAIDAALETSNLVRLN